MNMKQKKQLLLICASFLINGLMVVLTGTLITYLMSDYGMTHSQAGSLTSVQSIGNLVAGVLSGLVIRKTGRKKSSLLFCALFAGGYSGILLFRNVVPINAFIFFSGLGWGLCNNVCHLIASQKKMKTSSVYFLQTCYAVGAFLAPMVFNLLLIMKFGWKSSVWIVVISSIILLLFFMFADLEEEDENVKGNNDKNNTENDKDNKNKTINEKEIQNGNQNRIKKQNCDPTAILERKFYQNPRYYLCTIMFFCYGGAETVLNAWLITYLFENGIMSLKMAQMMLSLLWFVIIISRFSQSLIADKVKSRYLLLVQSAVLCILIGGLCMVRTETICIILIVIIGIFMGGMMPANAGNAREFMQGDGLSSGIMFAGGGLGSAVIPFLVGKMFENVSLTAGMKTVVVLLFFYFLTTILNIVFSKYERKYM